MNDDSGPGRPSALLPAAAGALAALTGAVVLAGWAADVAALRGVLPGLVEMKPNTAVGLLALGAALACLRADGRAGRRAGWVLAAAAVLIGLVTLVEYTTGANLGVDELLFRDPLTPAANHPGRMAPATAVSFALLGAALCLLDAPRRRGGGLAQPLALAVLILAFAVLVGHAYGADPVVRLGRYTAVAVYTAAALLVLAVGVLAARPRRGVAALVAAPTLGGVAVRRQLPVIVLVLAGFGWLRTAGQSAELVDTGVGTAIFVTASAVVFASLVLTTGRRLHRLDLRQRAATAAARDRAELLRATLAGVGDGLIATDAAGRVTLLNPVAEALTGWTQADAHGKPLTDVFVIVNESTRAPVDNPALRALRDGVVVGLANHTLLIHRDGTERPIDDSASPVRDAAGGVAGAVLVFRDISDRKRSEAELAERSRLVALRADVATALAADLPPADALQRCCRALVDHLGAAFARVWVLDGDALILRASAGLYTHLDGPHGRVPVGAFKIGRIAATGRPHLSNDVPHDPEVGDRDWAAREGMAAFAGYPLSVGGRVLGVVALFARRPLSATVLADLAPLADGVAQYLDRRRAEADARDARSRLDSTLAAGEVGTWEFDVVNDAVRADANLARLFGVTPAEAAGGPIAAYTRAIHPDDRARVGEAIGRALASGDGYEESYRLVGAGGAVRSVVARGRVERDAAGRALRLPGVVIDVSAQRRAEDAARAGEEKYRTLFETMAEGFCVIEVEFDPAGRAADYRHVEANPAFERHTGLRGALGLSVRQVVPGLEEFWFETYGRVAATGEPARIEHRADALGRWFDVSAVRLGGPGSRKVAVLFADTTARRRAEESLRASEARFRVMVEQVTDYAIFTTDPAGRATSWNEGVGRVLGFAEDDWVGRDLAPLIFTPEDARDGVPARELAEARATGRASNDRWMRKKDGGRFFAFGTTTALRDDAGHLIGFTKVMRDQTDRHRMEEELREFAAAASEADRRKDEFLAMLAHELRNPLAPIRNAVEVVPRAGDDPAAARRSFDMIGRQVAQMVRFVDDLLDVSRVSRGRIELRTGRVELASVVRQAAEAARPACDAKGHALVVSADPEVHVDGDPARLAQVVGNLLTNAAKFTPPSGRVEVSAGRDGTDAVVRVRDTGIGLAADELPRVFDLFAQVDTSLERTESGLGIGLTLVKRIVELHGGSVAVHSAGPGAGAEFTVRLPALPAAPPAPAEAPPPSASGPRRVLVVDDNRDSADSLAELLRLLGHEVRTAHDGEAAVAAAGAMRPDVILLDIGLPKLNGYEACRRIRSQPGGPGVFVAALTGWGQDGDRTRAADAGFDAHLTKPVELGTLVRLLAGATPPAGRGG